MVWLRHKCRLGPQCVPSQRGSARGTFLPETAVTLAVELQPLGEHDLERRARVAEAVG